MFHYLFGFSGRISRAKMWLFLLIAAVWSYSCLGIVCLAGYAGGLDDPWFAFTPFGPRTSVEWIATSVMYICFGVYLFSLVSVSVKRLHDRNKSAMWALLFWGTPVLWFVVLSVLGAHHLLPSNFVVIGGTSAVIVGGLMWWGLIEMLFFRGTRGENRFGPDPLHPQ